MRPVPKDKEIEALDDKQSLLYNVTTNRNQFQHNSKEIRLMAKANSAFMKPLKLSSELSAVVGPGPYPRSEVVKKLWEYIKKNKLQDAKNKRNINADDKLKAVFSGKGTVSMFEMNKLVAKHLS